ncbi:MAG TPA: hypothetical protein PK983_06160, partial [Syntrophales bacterium]|nr:hypothetical protein [Syntrophales bacterium]
DKTGSWQGTGIMSSKPKTWALNEISGSSSPGLKDYCLELFHALVTSLEVHGNETHRILHRDRATPEAYQTFHDRAKEASKREPGDTIIIHYTWETLYCAAKDDDGKLGEVHTIEYKNGVDRLISIEPATYIDEPLNDTPC